MMKTPANTPKTDIRVQNHGSIILLQILTGPAKVWVAEHIGETNGYQPYFPNSIVVEPRFVMDIVRGAIADGLVVH